MGGNRFRFNEIFIKIPKIPLYYQPFFFSFSSKKIQLSFLHDIVRPLQSEAATTGLSFSFVCCNFRLLLKPSMSFFFFSVVFQSFFFIFLFFMNCLLVIHESDIQCFCTPKNQNKLALCTPKNIESEKKRKLLLELPVQLKKNCIQNFESENCWKTAVNLKVRTAGELN